MTSTTSEKIRMSIAALVLAGVSVLGRMDIRESEGEVLEAYTPVKGDVPTIGVGATTYEDGTPVRLGDKITPERSEALLQHHLKAAAKIVATCAPVPMHQHEFDVFVAFAFNVGAGRKGVKDGFCTLKNGNMPTMRRHLLAGNYDMACAELLKWTNFQGKPLRGLVLLRSRQYETCRGLA